MSAQTPSYARLARWYDAIYDDRGKSYADEAGAVLALAAAEQAGGPGDGTVRSVLDVACGTGRHLAEFARRVGEIAGVDGSGEMLAIARARLGGGVRLVEADFRDFSLDATFDLVTCLFSSIGHVADAAELDAAVACMAAHVAPHGVLCLEPWLVPEGVRPGGVRDLVTAETDDGLVARAASSRQVGAAIELDFAWAIAEVDGVSTVEEHLLLPLFTRERYLDAFRAAGLRPAWLDQAAGWPGTRGLVLARRE
jgi:SAM-dependent methyltransferase